MTLLKNFFSSSNAMHYAETSKPFLYKDVYYVFDDNINDSNGIYLLNEEGYKCVQFANGVPQIQLRGLNDKQPFLTLHLQGSAKSICEHLFEEWQCSVKK
jgi:hypothetical protein